MKQRLAFILVVLVAVAAHSAVTTESGLRTALAAAAKAGPASSPVVVNGTIALTRPLDVFGFTRIVAGPNGGKLTSPSTQPLIHFRSQYGHGYSQKITIDGIDLEAPNADVLWDWPKETHAGNAENYLFRNGIYTAKRSHFNCEAPGDGRAYWFTFERITCAGTGAMMTGSPLIGSIDHCKQSDVQIASPFAIDVRSCELSVTDSWVQPIGAGVLRVSGEFSQVYWRAYSEPRELNGHPIGSQVIVDGPNILTTPGVRFVMPRQPLEVRNGGQIVFTGTPDYTDDGGKHADPTTQPSPALLQQVFKARDAKSAVLFTGGRVDAKGVTIGESVTASQPSN